MTAAMTRDDRRARVLNAYLDAMAEVRRARAGRDKDALTRAEVTLDVATVAAKAILIHGSALHEGHRFFVDKAGTLHAIPDADKVPDRSAPFLGRR